MASKRNSTAAPGRLHAVSGRSPARPAGDQIPQWVWFAVLVIASIFVYSPALRGPFIFDDMHLPFASPNAATAGAAFWIGGVRPVLMATYWVNFIVSGANTLTYHVGGLLLHALTAGLVFLLLRRLLDLADIQSDRRVMAIFGAGLFLLHPLQTESVAYIAGRSEVVAGLFYVAAWLLFVNHFGSDTKYSTAMAILLLSGAAIGGKESAITVPAILFLTDLYWNPASLLAQLRSRVKLYVPIVLGGILAAGKILQSLTSGTGAGFSMGGITPGRYALTQCRVIPDYIRLFLLPFGQNADWGLPFFRSLTDGAAWVFVLLMLALVGLILWSYRRARLLSFGLAVFLVALLPTSSVVPIQDALAERRVYVPIIGLILGLIWAIGYCASGWKPLLDGAAFRLAVTALLVMAAGLSFERTKVWGSDILLWGDSVSGNPSNSRAHMGLGDAHLVRGQCADAIREFQTVEKQAGISDEMTTNLAAAYQCNRQPDLALHELRSLKHPSPTTYDRIGYLEATQGNVSPALEAFEAALKLDPNDATAYGYRGTARLVLNDLTGARADLVRALQLDPSNDAALKGLASLGAPH